MKDIVRTLTIGGYTPASLSADVGLTIMRIGMGLMMAFGHGIRKIPPQEGFVQGVGDLGFPMPLFFAWMAGIAEFFCALALVLGLLTRPSAFMIAFTMAVAAFMRHWDDPLFAAAAENGSKEMAILFLLMALALMFTGSGRISADRAIRGS